VPPAPDNLRDFKRFCEYHNLVPHGEAIVDRGLSAYKATHRKKGRFGLFIQSIDEGLIPPGAVLVVEALDRISREEPDLATSLFGGILRKGIDIGVCKLGMVFTAADMGTSRYSIISNMFMLAHMESKQKAERVGESWKARRDKARAGGKLMSRRLPAWLESVNGEVRPIPEKVAVVGHIFRLATEGYGRARIVAELTGSGVPPFSAAGKWTTPYVNKMLTDRRVLGDLELIDGTTLEGYYPRVISKDVYDLARQAQRERAVGGPGRRLRDGQFINVFRSLLVHARDSEGFALHYRGTKKEPRLYLAGAAGRAGRTKETYTFPYSAFEEAVLSLLKEVDPAEVLGTDQSAPGPVEVLKLTPRSPP
jgi:DNA invertase Pin-like site-specific DNA recombinase